MTRPEFDQHLATWAADVKDEATRLFDRGADENECIGLAINVVESKRRKKQRVQAQFLPPRPKGH